MLNSREEFDPIETEINLDYYRILSKPEKHEVSKFDETQFRKTYLRLLKTVLARVAGVEVSRIELYPISSPRPVASSYRVSNIRINVYVIHSRMNIHAYSPDILKNCRRSKFELRTRCGKW